MNKMGAEVGKTKECRVENMDLLEVPKKEGGRKNRQRDFITINKIISQGRKNTPK